MATQLITAYFDGKPCEIEFSLGLGIVPGSGTAIFSEIFEHVPKRGTLEMSDGIRTIILYDVYADKPRDEYSAENGHSYTVTLYDRRCVWKWGKITGHYNKKSPDGSSAGDTTLQRLIELCLMALNEHGFILTGVPTVYPEVLWEFENPANALNTLCEVYGLAISMTLDVGNPIKIMPVNKRTSLPDDFCENFVTGLEGDLLPQKIYLVGGRKVIQKVFHNLIPVGEDLDGTIKKIKDLTYAPSGYDTYSDEQWGREYVAMFSNLSSDMARQLALKCIFKWYAIDWATEIVDSEVVLPFLSDLSEVGIVEGVEKHLDPYVLMNKVTWDGVTYDISDEEDNKETKFEFDKDLGIIKFTKPQYVSNAEGTAVRGFTRATIHLTAAYESKYGDEGDFEFWEDVIVDGTELPVIYKAEELVGYYVKNEDTGAYVCLNESIIDNQANDILRQLKQNYVVGVPYVKTYVGVLRVVPYGRLKNVTWRVDSSGAQTVVQYGINIPLRHMPTYEERLNKRKLSFLLDELK